MIITFDLSPREKKLLRRFASGKTDKEIARELGDREARIAAERQRINEKPQIQTGEQLVMLADRLAIARARVVLRADAAEGLCPFSLRPISE
jgi:DNA-binding CsgD family transcriptional regulator